MKKRVSGGTMLLPYRVKNLPRTLPVATIMIVFINVLVFIFTTEGMISIKDSVVESWAYAPGKMPFYCFVTAAFLHGDLLHIAGNMLFLWVFGPPVEDRLGIPKFLGVYFATGLCGDLLQTGVELLTHHTPVVGIGASGCIMGILGAYWFIFSWSTVCVYCLFFGIWEVQAIWFIGIYFLLDVYEGVVAGHTGGGGVANFAHIGGALAGALLCMLLKVRRDTVKLSRAKAIQADAKDLSLMPLHALRTMLDQEPDNPELIRAVITPALNAGDIQLIHDTFTKTGSSLADRAPDLVSYYLTALKGNAAIYRPGQILMMAARKEREGDPEQALQLYRMLVENHPTASEVERALYGLASCYWKAYQDIKSARTCLTQMARRFPNGPMTSYGKELWQQMVENQR